MKNYTGPVLIIIAALLWAFDGVIRRSLYDLPPITIIFYEHLVGLIILSPFIFRYVIRTRFTKKEFWMLILISVLSGLLGTLWFTTALLKVHFISFSVVFLLQKLQPIFAITTARIFLKEKLERGYLLWACLALLSAYFVTFKNGVINLETGEGTIIAALYALGAAFAWGSSTTFSKILLTKIETNVVVFYRFLFTIILSLPLVLIFGYGSSIGSVTVSQLGLFALIAITSGMVALYIYYKGLSKTPVHITTILELTFPFIAILIDMKLYDNNLILSQWIAACALVFSIYQITRIQANRTDEVIQLPRIQIQ